MGLENLLNIPDSEARERYNRTVTVAGSRVIIKDYKEYSTRVKDGIEVTNIALPGAEKPKTDKTVLEKYKAFRADNVHRSKNDLINLVTTNAEIMESFITLTFRDDNLSIKECMDLFDKWKKKIKYHYDFTYQGLTVKDTNNRKVIHLHLLCNIPVNSKIIPKREPKKFFDKETKTYKTRFYYDLSFWEHGYSLALPLGDTYEDKIKTAIYTAKYSVKDLNIMLFDTKVWTATKGLDRPKIYYIDTETQNDSKMNYDEILKDMALYEKPKKVKPKRYNGKEFTQSVFVKIQ